jgi:hypothetical protein
MGRAARERASTKRETKKTAGIRIEPTDYWELRTRIRDIEAIEFDLLKQRQAGLERLEAAKRACEATVARLATKYSLPAAPFAFKWNDERLELLPQLPPTSPTAVKGK